MVTLQQYYRKFSLSLAKGLNRAAERFSEDIQAQTPIRTGKLRAGYRVSKRATSEDLSTRIGPSERYGANFYPFKDSVRAFGRRQAQKPARARLFGQGRVYSERRGRIVREEIGRALREGRG